MGKRGRAPFLHPLGGCGYRRFWKHYLQNWPYDLRSLHTRICSLLGVTVRIPSVFFEASRHNAAIAAESLGKGPVFIVGHWRSGTTHLHNLLSRDPQFGFISFSRSAMPLDCLGKVRPARALMNLVMPKDRGMDSVAINADTPQEEEMALGALGEICFYKSFYFPRKLDHHFRRSVLLQGLEAGEREQLADNYRFLVQKMAYAHGGKTVLFKNPANTARLSFLKEVFPTAKFVHIVRDPYKVYPSMLKLWDRLMRGFSWQNPRGIDFEETTLSIYERTMRAHIEDQGKIPAQDFHEVRYEDLDADPAGELSRIYDALDLPGKSRAMDPIEQYIKAQRGYRKNTYRLPAATKERIASRWKFAFNHWNYAV
jgi:hypothetical protein